MERREIVAGSLSVLFALVGSSSAHTTTSASSTYEEVLQTTIFLPSALFSPIPVQQDFNGIFSTTSGTTFFSVGLNFSNNHTEFAPALITNYDWSGYPFSASAAGTQYVWQNLTINCPSPTPAGTAMCTTTSTNLDITNSPTYNTVAESSFYNARLINRNTTVPTPPLTPTVLKVGIGLGAPLALCLCALIVLFICRHREHKRRSRLGHTRAFAMVGREMKLEPLVMPGGGGSTGFEAYGEGVEGGSEEGHHGVAVSEVSAFTNELHGEGKAGRKELA